MADGPPGSWPSQRNSQTDLSENADALGADGPATLNVNSEDPALTGKRKGKDKELIGQKHGNPKLPAEISET